MSRTVIAVLMTLVVSMTALPADAAKRKKDPRVVQSVNRALDYLAREQRRQGYWEANGGQYRVAMTALAGNALLCEGSTTTRGRYAKSVRLAVDYLMEMSRPNGLIGFKEDYHYTYGHGFSMLFLSQVFGEEEDVERREELKKVLTRAVAFSAQAQPSRGGWGYVSAKDQPNFDRVNLHHPSAGASSLQECRNRRAN